MKSRTFDFTVVLGIVLLFVLISIAGVVLDGSYHDILSAIEGIEIPEPVGVEDMERAVYTSRDSVNHIIWDLMASGDTESVYVFYDDFTKSREITTVIIAAAFVFDIPVNLLFALVEWESRFNPMAVNENHTSVDRGLMQLNSRSFELSEQEFFNIPINVRYGTAYLRQQFDATGSWEKSLTRYNGGPGSVVSASVIHHLSSVLAFERRYDAVFVETFQ